MWIRLVFLLIKCECVLVTARRGKTILKWTQMRTHWTQNHVLKHTNTSARRCCYWAASENIQVFSITAQSAYYALHMFHAVSRFCEDGRRMKCSKIPNSRNICNNYSLLCLTADNRWWISPEHTLKTSALHLWRNYLLNLCNEDEQMKWWSNWIQIRWNKMLS